jgi:hypothetical protein
MHVLINSEITTLQLPAITSYYCGPEKNFFYISVRLLRRNYGC